MSRMTRQRLIIFATLGRGPATFPAIMAALGLPPEYSRGDYARVHRIVMDLVREGLVSHQKQRRHHASTFTLTPLGQERAAAYRADLETRLQLLAGSSIPSATPRLPSTVELPPPQPLLDSSLGQKVSQKRTGEVTCSTCGESISLDRARMLIEGGSKVLCRCTNDLTSLARDALVRLELE